MNNPPVRRNKLEIQVYRGVKGVEDRGVAESREKTKRESEQEQVCAYVSIS
jgi:hypothetical protein